MTHELMNIIEENKLDTVFQPIISLRTGDILGYEALTRGRTSSRYKNPEMLFEHAKKFNMLWDLEILCRENAIKAFSKYKSDKLLFINVDPDVIKDEHFIKGFTKEVLNEYNINPMSIIFEITEKTSILNYETFNEVINYYKSQGYKIAIDDVGTGYSGLTTIANTRPYYIKLDMSLVAGVNRDNFKKAIIKSFVEFADSTNIKVIAEGIEDINDLNVLIEIGVHYAQGYLISRPAPLLVESNELIKRRIVDKNNAMKRYNFYPSSDINIGQIARQDNSFLPDTPCVELEENFKNNHNLQGVSIVNSDSSIVGLVMKSKFLSKVGTQYGWSIFMKRPIQLIMDTNPLVLDFNTPLDKVSKLVISREEEKLYDYILVEKNNKYYGVVPVITLLEKIMEYEVNIAKYSNPLTGLPGNVVIESNISQLISDNKDFSLLYFDLNDFKAFNDTYGFENGDKILSFTANIIQKNVSHNINSFVGHIGGDDFVAIIQPEDTGKVCKNIINDFDNNILDFYGESDKDSLGGEFPIMSISISAIVNRNEYSNIYDLTKDAAKIKKICKVNSKQENKSSFLIQCNEQLVVTNSK